MAAVSASVLVLNQNYEPLNVCPVRRAIVLVTGGKAEVVEESPGGYLRTVTRVFRIPSIIRLLYHIRRPRPIARLARREVFARDRYACQYCGTRTPDLTLDHVVPRHQGGTHTWENLVSACRRCNHRKAGRTPEEAHMRLQSAPRRPSANLATMFAAYLESRPTWALFFHRRGRDDLAASAGG